MGYLTTTVRARPNLEIVANARVERILFRGRTAIGAEVRRSGERSVFRAREIIVSAGALHSPAVLMRSGVGPPDELRRHGITIVHGLAGVGQHLMNHVNASIAVLLQDTAVQPLSQRGFGQSCLRVSSGLEGTDCGDMILVPINKTAWHPLGRRVGAIGIEVHKTYSLGEVRLRSADLNAAPHVRFNLLSDERDLARLMFGLKLAVDVLLDPRMATVSSVPFLPNGTIVRALGRRTAWNQIRAWVAAFFLRSSRFRDAILGNSVLDLNRLSADPAELRLFALQNAGPPHHVSCTCRMGQPGNADIVVDPQCRVIGVDRLRVVDASIMPNITTANTHIPVLMIAEKAADLIRAASH
jgi:5-(hydroxymethyl)furfural/furfural oxidase